MVQGISTVVVNTAAFIGFISMFSHLVEEKVVKYC